MATRTISTSSGDWMQSMYIPAGSSLIDSEMVRNPFVSRFLIQAS